MEVVANIGKAAEAEQAVSAGSEGVGLMRTEFLFLGRKTPPDEDEQYQQYTIMLKSLNGLPMGIRTLDIGGDKEVAYLDLPTEDNPFPRREGHTPLPEQSGTFFDPAESYLSRLHTWFISDYVPNGDDPGRPGGSQKTG